MWPASIELLNVVKREARIRGNTEQPGKSRKGLRRVTTLLLEEFIASMRRQARSYVAASRGHVKDS